MHRARIFNSDDTIMLNRLHNTSRNWVARRVQIDYDFKSIFAEPGGLLSGRTPAGEDFDSNAIGVLSCNERPPRS